VRCLMAWGLDGTVCSIHGDDDGSSSARVKARAVAAHGPTQWHSGAPHAASNDELAAAYSGDIGMFSLASIDGRLA